MPPKPIKTLDVGSRGRWRSWLERHHDSESEIWLVFHKRHTGAKTISYGDALDEALCFGWIDSLVRRLDDDRYARKFTPRKADSRWSTINRKRYAQLKAEGKLAAPGLARPPTDKSGDAPERSPAVLPTHLEEHLKMAAGAWAHFQKLAPSHQRTYIRWIISAKREETRLKRLREAITMLERGEKLGLR